MSGVGSSDRVYSSAESVVYCIDNVQGVKCSLAGPGGGMCAIVIMRVRAYGKYNQSTIHGQSSSSELLVGRGLLPSYSLAGGK